MKKPGLDNHDKNVNIDDIIIKVEYILKEKIKKDWPS